MNVYTLKIAKTNLFAYLILGSNTSVVGFVSIAMARLCGVF